MLRSRPPREDGWPPEGDPRRISASDLDAAMALARLRFGAEARAIAARRVSRGVPGLGGKVNVEIWVQPAPTTVVVGDPELEPNAFCSLDTLIARANAADEVVASRSVSVITQVITEPHPAPDVLADPMPRAAIPRQQQQRRWSKAALGRLGVPGVVVSALNPPEDPTDAKWVAALAGAIATSLPEPCLAGVAVAHGTGGDGALMLLRTALAGVALGTLTTARGPSPATPVALAAAIGELL